MRFLDRRDAGRRLAAELLRFKARHPVVLALPRGGVPVGFEIAARLGAPLDVVLVRKIGHPAQPELAVGAVADGAVPEKVIDTEAFHELGVGRAYLNRELAHQLREIERRRRLYFKTRRPVDIQHGTALVVDDGIATGATMRAALRAVRRRAPDKLILAVPVASPDTLDELRFEADEVICLHVTGNLGAVGECYDDFRPVEDETVVALLDRAAAMEAARKRPVPLAPEDR